MCQKEAVQLLNVSIKMDRKGIECEGLEWINLARVTVQRQASLNTILNPWVPSETEYFLANPGSVSPMKRWNLVNGLLG